MRRWIRTVLLLTCFIVSISIARTVETPTVPSIIANRMASISQSMASVFFLLNLATNPIKRQSNATRVTPVYFPLINPLANCNSRKYSFHFGLEQFKLKLSLPLEQACLPAAFCFLTSLAFKLYMKWICNIASAASNMSLWRGNLFPLTFLNSSFNWFMARPKNVRKWTGIWQSTGWTSAWRIYTGFYPGSHPCLPTAKPWRNAQSFQWAWTLTGGSLLLVPHIQPR